MLSIAESSRIFVARDAADFRKQFDGLAAIARDQFGMDPCSGSLFVFFNKRRDRIKVLVFEHTGFWLHYKRLERGTFDSLVDRDTAEDCVEVEARSLRMLLDGIDLRRAKFRRHFADPVRVERRRHEDRQQAAD
jgi:transposase